jgi:hypothetical protein
MAGNVASRQMIGLMRNCSHCVAPSGPPYSVLPNTGPLSSPFPLQQELPMSIVRRVKFPRALVRNVGVAIASAFVHSRYVHGTLAQTGCL